MDELQKIVTASSDKKIKVFDYPSFKESLVLEGHTDWVYKVIKVDANRILSSSRDTTVKLWNIENGVCEHTFSGHTGKLLKNDSLLIYKYYYYYMNSFLNFSYNLEFFSKIIILFFNTFVNIIDALHRGLEIFN